MRIGTIQRSIRQFIFSLLFVALVLVQQATAAEPVHLKIGPRVLQSHVERFGINLGYQSYFDSGQILRNLIARNPGFEGMHYQSIVHCARITTHSCTDDNNYTVWPADFWDGASVELLSAPNSTSHVLRQLTAHSAGKEFGVTLDFGSDLASLKAGDYIALRKDFKGGVTDGWWAKTTGQAGFGTEFKDLSPHTSGHQAIRIESTGKANSAQLAQYFDTVEGISFLHLRSNLTLNFRAKSLAGSQQIHIQFRRVSNPQIVFFDEGVKLQSGWNDYHLTIPVSPGQDHGSGPLQLNFDFNDSSLLFDDVELLEAASPENPTVFRDDVVRALRQLHPGVLRLMDAESSLGTTLDNWLAPEFARQRSGYSAYQKVHEDIPYGLHDFLVLCEAIHADPWITLPTALTTTEAAHLIEYLSGPTNTSYGALRARLGHPLPWTTSFQKLSLELGNEPWNSVYRGETIENPTVYGARSRLVFGALRASPYYASTKMNLILNGLAVSPEANATLLSASKGYDTLAIAPYLLYSLDAETSAASAFDRLTTETNTDGLVTAQAKVTANAHPAAKLAVYEVNLHTTDGSASQQQLDAVAPSLGAGLAVTNHMLHMLREQGVREQALFSLAGYRYLRKDGKTVRLWGSVVDMGNTNRKRPTFLALEAINSALSGEMHEVMSTQSDPFLECYSFVNGGEESLILINLSSDSLRKVTLDDLAHATEIRAQRLTAASITSNNEISEEVVLRTVVLHAGTFSLPPHSLTVVHWKQ